MKPLSIRTVCDYIGGRPDFDAIDGAVNVRAVSTDSRKVAAGDLFVALRGESFDGHAYLNSVAAAGAVAAIVDSRGTGYQPMKDDHGLVAHATMPLLIVPDTRRALGALAAKVRDHFTRTKVVAVAGSNGKTSTKHLVHTALSAGRRGTMSPKSFNNDIGVPLTIFPVDDATDDFVVLELGTNHPGEIATLGAISHPDIVVITNCGEEHLEFLGDLDGVRAENASLVDYIRPAGTLIVNGDDPLLLEAVGRFGGTVVRFGLADSNDLIARDVRIDEHATSFELDGRRVSVPLLGRHNALNALAAIAVGRQFGLNDESLAAALASSSKPEMRMERVDVDGITILNDAYNANPASMRAGLETLTAFTPPAGGRRVAVLGDMRELGPVSERYHRETGAFIAESNGAIDLLVCVGDDASRWIAGAAQTHGFTAPIATFPDSTAAAAAVVKLVNRGDLVLVKGSRGVRLERVVDGIVNDRAAVSR